MGSWEHIEGLYCPNSPEMTLQEPRMTFHRRRCLCWNLKINRSLLGNQEAGGLIHRDRGRRWRMRVKNSVLWRWKRMREDQQIRMVHMGNGKRFIWGKEDKSRSREVMRSRVSKDLSSYGRELIFYLYGMGHLWSVFKQPVTLAHSGLKNIILVVIKKINWRRVREDARNCF